MLNTTPEIEMLVRKLADFCIKNTRKGVFEKWSREQMIETFRLSMFNCELLYLIDSEDEVLGIVHGKKNERFKVFYVENILAIDKKAMALFLYQFSWMYPEYTIEALRHGKHKIYSNVERFKNKVRLQCSKELEDTQFTPVISII